MVVLKAGDMVDAKNVFNFALKHENTQAHYTINKMEKALHELMTKI